MLSGAFEALLGLELLLRRPGAQLWYLNRRDRTLNPKDSDSSPPSKSTRFLSGLRGFFGGGGGGGGGGFRSLLNAEARRV